MTSPETSRVAQGLGRSQRPPSPATSPDPRTEARARGLWSRTPAIGWLLALVVAVVASSPALAAAAAPLGGRSAWLPRDLAERKPAQLVPVARPPVRDEVILGRPGPGPWGAAFSGLNGEPRELETDLGEAELAEPTTLDVGARASTPAIPDPRRAASWAAAFGPTAPASAAMPSPSPSFMGPPLGPPPLHFGVLTAVLAPEAGPAESEPVEASAAVRTEPAEASSAGEGRLAGRGLISARGVPPFWIEREYQTHFTRAIAFPPLFIHRKPKADHPEAYFHADLALNFGWYSENNERRHWLNPIGLVYGYKSERKTLWGAAPLLMGYRRIGEQFNFGQFPLVWWWGTKFVKNVLVVPFHYQQRAPESFRGVSGLIAWYGHKNLHDADLTNDRRYLVVAPLFWRFQRGLRRFDFSPLYFGGTNKLAGLRHMTVLPLFHWESREFGNRRELWTLPWIRRVDEARRKAAWAVPLAFTFSHRDPDREVLAATPLVWRTRNHLKGSELWLAGPFGRYTDPDQRNMAIAPLWFRFHDVQTQRTTSVVAPLGLALRGPQELRVYTLLGGGGRTANGWRMSVPPLLTFAGRTDRGVRYQGLAGLAWHVRQPDADGVRGRDAWVLGPLGFLSRDADGGQLGLVPALSFVKWGGTRRYQVITPLLWHVRDVDPAHPSRTFVAGPFYHRVTGGPQGEQFDGGVAPFVFYGRGRERNYGIIPWLLLGDVTDVAEQRRLTVSPLFVRSKSPDHRTLGVGLLAWDVVRGSDERHSVLFPLYYRRRVGDHQLTLTPLGGRLARGDELTTVWGPWVRRRQGDRDTRGLMPFVILDDRPADGGMAHHVVVPPFVFHRRAPNDDLDMWSPLVWRSEIRGERARRGLAVVPFYFRQRQPGGVDVDAGLGFFWSRDDRRHTHTIVAGPAFHRLSRESLHTGVFPLYWWMDTHEKRRLIALPFSVHVEDKLHDSHTTIAIPLWFDRKQVNGRRTWGAFPFVFGGRRISSFTRFSLAPPGYLDVFRLTRNERFTGVVPLVFRYQKCGFRAEDEASCRYTMWGSAPLFLYGRDGQGRVTHGSLVYYWDRRPDGYRLYTPVFGLTNIPGKTLGWYAGPVGVRTTNTWRRTFAFPLFYRRTHRLEKRSFTVAAPPLFISRQRKDKRFFEAGLVVWQFRQPHKVATAVVPPIFFHSHAYAERRLTWLAPLFLRDDHWAKDEAWTAVGPALYVQRRHGKNLDFVQFPLIWHIERDDSQGTFGAFAWWDIRTRKGKTFQWVPGAYLRWATREHDTKVIGPGLGWWTKGRGATEGDLHWRALFGAFGGGREDGQRYLALFGARIPRGAAVRVEGSSSRRAQRKLRRQARQTARKTARQAARQAGAARARQASSARLR